MKLTALTVAFVFTVTSITWTTPAVAAPTGAAAPAVLPMDTLAIPSEMGSISKTYFGERGTGNEEREAGSDDRSPLTVSRDDRTVILIQDAHAVVDAQENIVKILGHLQKSYGVRLTALEGAKGRLEPILLKTFPEPSIKRKILAGYEKRAELTGPEMAAVLQEDASEFRGMENWGLYEKNYSAYLQVQQKKDPLLSQWNTFKQSLDRERAKVYDSDLNEFEEVRENFLSERASLLDLLLYLSKFQNLLKTASGYQELPGLIASIGYEQSGKPEALVPLVRKIADEFKVKYLRGLGVKAEMNFYNRYQAFNTGQITAGQMLQYLVQLGSEHGKVVELTPVLKKLLGHAEILSEIKGSRLCDELESFLSEVESSLTKTPAERELSEKYQKLFLLKGMIALELTHEDLAKYQKEPDAYLSLVADPAFKQDLAPALEFYQAALERDQAFMEKIDAMMKDTKQKAVAVVAGGFHTRGLERILKEKGVAYAVVTPKIASLTGAENYATVMKGDVSFKDYLKTTYFDALMRHAAKALVEALPIQERVRTLKTWRDNVIRELAKDGRITEAGKYLPYIDEILQSMPEAAAALSPKRTKEEILDIVRKELEKFKKDSFERIWKTFEFQLDIFTDGLKQPVSKKELSAQTVSALLDRASQTQPSFLGSILSLDPAIFDINKVATKPPALPVAAENVMEEVTRAPKTSEVMPAVRSVTGESAGKSESRTDLTSPGQMSRVEPVEGPSSVSRAGTLPVSVKEYWENLEGGFGGDRLKIYQGAVGRNRLRNHQNTLEILSKLGSGIQVAEVGVGWGQLSLDILSLPNVGKLYAVDINASDLKELRLRTDLSRSEHLETIKADIYDTQPLERVQNLDAIVSLETLWHLSDTRKAIEIFRDKLKPGGVLIVNFMPKGKALAIKIDNRGIAKGVLWFIFTSVLQFIHDHFSWPWFDHWVGVNGYLRSLYYSEKEIRELIESDFKIEEFHEDYYISIVAYKKGQDMRSEMRFEKQSKEKMARPNEKVFDKRSPNVGMGVAEPLALPVVEGEAPSAIAEADRSEAREAAVVVETAQKPAVTVPEVAEQIPQVDREVKTWLNQFQRDLLKVVKYLGLQGSGSRGLPESVLYPNSEELYQMLLDGVTIKPGDRIWEVGTGTGVITYLLAKFTQDILGVSFWATDIDLPAVKIASEMLKPFKNVRVLQGDLSEPLHGEKVDIAIWNAPWFYEPMFGTTYGLHMVDPGYETILRFLKEAGDYLKPDGQIYLLFPVEYFEKLKTEMSKAGIPYSFELKSSNKKKEGLEIGLFEYDPMAARRAGFSEAQKLKKGVPSVARRTEMLEEGPRGRIPVSRAAQNRELLAELALYGLMGTAAGQYLRSEVRGKKPGKLVEFDKFAIVLRELTIRWSDPSKHLVRGKVRGAGTDSSQKRSEARFQIPAEAIPEKAVVNRHDVLGDVVDAKEFNFDKDQWEKLFADLHKQEEEIFGTRVRNKWKRWFTASRYRIYVLVRGHQITGAIVGEIYPFAKTARIGPLMSREDPFQGKGQFLMDCFLSRMLHEERLKIIRTTSRGAQKFYDDYIASRKRAGIFETIPKEFPREYAVELKADPLDPTKYGDLRKPWGIRRDQPELSSELVYVDAATRNYGVRSEAREEARQEVVVEVDGESTEKLTKLREIREGLFTADVAKINDLLRTIGNNFLAYRNSELVRIHKELLEWLKEAASDKWRLRIQDLAKKIEAIVDVQNEDTLFPPYIPENAPKVAVIIPIHNKLNDSKSELKRKSLRDILYSLALLDYPSPKIEIIIIDNGSPDTEFARTIKKNFPNVRVVRSSANLGFAGGINAGIRDAMARGADFFFLVNDDVYVTDPKVLTKLLRVAEQDGIGFVGMPLVNPLGEKWIEQKGLRVPRPKARKEETERYWEVDAVAGSAFIVSRKTVEKVGLIEPRFFLYWEETDWNARAAAAGLKNIVVKTTRMVHKEEGGGVFNANSAYYLMRNMVFYARRNLQGPFFHFVWPFFIFAGFAMKILTASHKQVFGSRYTILSRALKGFWDGLNGIWPEAIPAELAEVQSPEKQPEQQGRRSEMRGKISPEELAVEETRISALVDKMGTENFWFGCELGQLGKNSVLPPDEARKRIIGALGWALYKTGFHPPDEAMFRAIVTAMNEILWAIGMKAGGQIDRIEVSAEAETLYRRLKEIPSQDRAAILAEIEKFQKERSFSKGEPQPLEEDFKKEVREIFNDWNSLPSQAKLEIEGARYVDLGHPKIQDRLKGKAMITQAPERVFTRYTDQKFLEESLERYEMEKTGGPEWRNMVTLEKNEVQIMFVKQKMYGRGYEVNPFQIDTVGLDKLSPDFLEKHGCPSTLVSEIIGKARKDYKGRVGSAGPHDDAKPESNYRVKAHLVEGHLKVEVDRVDLGRRSEARGEQPEQAIADGKKIEQLEQHLFQVAGQEVSKLQVPEFVGPEFQDQVNRDIQPALAKGGVIAVDLSRLAEVNGRLDRFIPAMNLLAEIVRKVLEEANPDLPEGNYRIPYVFQEFFKNAFYHGNGMEFALPVYLRVDAAGRKISVYDFGKGTPQEKALQSEATKTWEISGHGVGIETIQDLGWDYSGPADVVGSAGEVVGKVTSIHLPDQTTAGGVGVMPESHPQKVSSEEGKPRFKASPEKRSELRIGGLVVEADPAQVAEKATTVEGIETVHTELLGQGRAEFRRIQGMYDQSAGTFFEGLRKQDVAAFVTTSECERLLEESFRNVVPFIDVPRLYGGMLNAVVMPAAGIGGMEFADAGLKLDPKMIAAMARKIAELTAGMKGQRVVILMNRPSNDGDAELWLRMIGGLRVEQAIVLYKVGQQISRRWPELVGGRLVTVRVKNDLDRSKKAQGIALAHLGELTVSLTDFEILNEGILRLVRDEGNWGNPEMRKLVPQLYQLMILIYASASEGERRAMLENPELLLTELNKRVNMNLKFDGRRDGMIRLDLKWLANEFVNKASVESAA
ncbi:MAG: glycosyltransferase [Candidatus Omnitrophota bacterium]